MGFWDDVKDAFGGGAKKDGKAKGPTLAFDADAEAAKRKEVEAKPGAEQLAADYGLSVMDANVLIMQHGSAAKARSDEFGDNPTAHENAAKRLSESMGVDIDTARQLERHASSLVGAEDAFIRARHAGQVAFEDVRFSENRFRRMGQLAHLAHEEMAPQKTPIRYPGLSDEQNADIAKRSRDDALAMHRHDDDTLASMFGDVKDASFKPSRYTRDRQHWVQHMSSQQRYQNLTGKPAPEGLPILSRGEGGHKIVMPDARDRDAVSGEVSRLSAMPDEDLRRRFGKLPDPDRIDFPAGGPAREYRLRMLIHEEVGLELDRQRRMRGATTLPPMHESISAVLMRGRAQQASGLAPPASKGPRPLKTAATITGQFARMMKSVHEHAEGRGLER